MAAEFSMTTDLAGQKKLVGPLFAAFSAAGFTAVHWCQDWTGEPVFYGADFAEQVRQLAELHRLRVADVHGYGAPPEGVAYTDELFAAMNINRAEFAARLGAGAVVLHLPARKAEPVDEALDQSASLLRAIRPAFEKLGVRAAVENLPWTAHTDEFFDSLLGRFDAGFLGFCYDSGHALVSNQSHLLARHAGRLLVTHLHDNDGSKDQHRLPGEGRADWGEIVRVLKQSGYRGTINLELHLPEKAGLEAFCRQGFAALSRLWERTA